MNKFGILCFAVAVFAVCHVESSPLKRPEATEYQNCKKICGLCDCVGFYCGDECICECHNRADGNLNCISDVQNNCERSSVPFEVLIQGPSGSRFVRSLVLADSEARKEPIDPTYVSTISVYQPNGHKKLMKREAKPDIDGDVAEALSNSGMNADAATIDEQTQTDDMRQAGAADGQKDEKVGLALPIAPLIGAKLLPLTANLGLLKAGLGAKLLPFGVGVANLANPALNPITNLGLNPIFNPAILPAKLAALKAKVGLGILPIAAPIGGALAPIAGALAPIGL